MKSQMLALASDEDNVMVWDIDRLVRELDSEIQPQMVATERLRPGEWLQIDRDYAMKTDVTRPILVFELLDNRAFTADGNYRLYKAVSTGVQSMHVIFVPYDVHTAYILNYDREKAENILEALDSEGIFVLNPFSSSYRDEEQ